MISRKDVFDAFVSVLEDALSVPVRKWNRNIDEMDPAEDGDSVYVAPFGALNDDPQEIGYSGTYMKALFF